jgi:hypothetical protein
MISGIGAVAVCSLLFALCGLFVAWLSVSVCSIYSYLLIVGWRPKDQLAAKMEKPVVDDR